MTLIDLTLSDARRFYSSMGNPLAVKGLTAQLNFPLLYKDFLFAQSENSLKMYSLPSLISYELPL